MGVGGCGWPSSANVVLIVRPCFTLVKSAPNSASAAYDATNFEIVKRVKIGPFSVIGYPSLGTEPRKKYTDARLLELFVDR